ncbi:MAG: hypothetical protein U1E89_08055 [Burkholderiaceae bacterium]
MPHSACPPPPRTAPQAPAASGDAEFDALVRAVQRNAHIADARHAADLPLCIFLLQMREYYRWESGLGFDAAIDRGALGHWLAERERLWDGLEDASYATLPWAGRCFDPLDADALNRELLPRGWVYTAAWDGARRPLFALAALRRAEPAGHDTPALLDCAEEFARSLLAPPAALVGARTIVLRREALARWLWERAEIALQRTPSPPWRALADAFALHDAPRFAAAQAGLVDALLPMLEWHERGEFRAAQRLEPLWAALRLALRQRPVDAPVRAVRDLLVDLETTLPALLDADARWALHGWFAMFEGWRERLCPALRPAYETWCDGDGGAALRTAADEGARHFAALAQELLALHASAGDAAAAAITERLDGDAAVFRGVAGT